MRKIIVLAIINFIFLKLAYSQELNQNQCLKIYKGYIIELFEKRKSTYRSYPLDQLFVENIEDIKKNLNYQELLSKGILINRNFFDALDIERNILSKNYQRYNQAEPDKILKLKSKKQIRIYKVEIVGELKLMSLESYCDIAKDASYHSNFTSEKAQTISLLYPYIIVRL